MTNQIQESIRKILRFTLTLDLAVVLILLIVGPPRFVLPTSYLGIFNNSEFNPFSLFLLVPIIALILVSISVEVYIHLVGIKSLLHVILGIALASFTVYLYYLVVSTQSKDWIVVIQIKGPLSLFAAAYPPFPLVPYIFYTLTIAFGILSAVLVKPALHLNHRAV